MNEFTTKLAKIITETFENRKGQDKESERKVNLQNGSNRDTS